MDASLKEREITSAENEKMALLKGATAANFVKHLAIAGGCWMVFIFLGTIYYQQYAARLGLLNIPVIFLYSAAILAAIWFSFIFCYEWLAVVTLKTPVQYRSIVHFSGAVILACLYTFVEDNPFSALRKTIIYFESHGFFVLKLVVVALIVGAFAYSYARNAKLRDFPRYPLRWYALLVVVSMATGIWLRPEDDTLSAFHWYERSAYYTGTVTVAYASFFVGSLLGTNAPPNNNTT